MRMRMRKTFEGLQAAGNGHCWQLVWPGMNEAAIVLIMIMTMITITTMMTTTTKISTTTTTINEQYNQIKVSSEFLNLRAPSFNFPQAAVRFRGSPARIQPGCRHCRLCGWFQHSSNVAQQWPRLPVAQLGSSHAAQQPSQNLAQLYSSQVADIADFAVGGFSTPAGCQLRCCSISSVLQILLAQLESSQAAQ